MFSSDLVDVVIGVVFAWFLLSLAVSAVNESFTWLTRARAKLLWNALGQLFDDGVAAADARLRSIAVQLPKGGRDIRPVATTEASNLSKLREKATATAPEPPEKLSALYDIVHRRVPDPAPANWRTRISHIPTEIVGDAVTSLAARTVTRASLLTVIDEEDAELRGAVAALGDGALDRDTARTAMPAGRAEDFDRAWAAAAEVVTIDDLEALLGGNETLTARLRAALVGLSDHDTAVRARQEVERWFDGSMDALSRFYRRQNRKIVALIAVPIVLLANADVFDLVTRLREDQALRAAATSSAAAWAAEPLTEEACPPAEGDDVEADPVAESRRRFECASELLESTDLIGPIGLRTFSLDGIPGRIVTYLALLFGASFWYDALRRLIGLRGKMTGGRTG
jgi:hypothetical protein